MPRAPLLMLMLWSGLALADGLPDLGIGARSGSRIPPPQRLAPAPAALNADSGISPGEAARRAQQINNGGRVLSVEPAGDGWRVKLIKEGDVRIVFVPD